MASCLRFGRAGNTNAGAPSATNYYMDDSGQGITPPGMLAQFVLPDSTTPNLSQCALVGLSGNEYSNIMAFIGSGSTGTVQTPSYPAWNELGSLSIADAQVVSAYVGLLWAGVWGIKQIAKAMSFNGRNEDE